MHPIYNVGLNVTEVAHNYQSTIKTYVEQLRLVNSYDTWHGLLKLEIRRGLQNFQTRVCAALSFFFQQGVPTYTCNQLMY